MSGDDGCRQSYREEVGECRHCGEQPTTRITALTSRPRSGRPAGYYRTGLACDRHADDVRRWVEQAGQPITTPIPRAAPVQTRLFDEAS